MKHFLPIIALTTLAACATTEPEPNTLTVEAEMAEEKLSFSGRAGAGMSESDIKGYIVTGQCEPAGKSFESMKLVPQDDGTTDIFLVCS